MPTDYPGNPAATQAPSPPPARDVAPIIQLPVDADAFNAASHYQVYKTLADFIAWLTLHGAFEDTANTFAALNTFSLGVVITQATANTNAVTATGNGTGTGVAGTGGTTSGPGLKGTGGAPNGIGMLGQGTGSGPGVKGIGGNVGVGILGVGTASDLPISAMQDSAGNNRFLVDHNGFPLGHLSHFYQGWCPAESINATSTSTKIPDLTMTLLAGGTGTAATQDPTATYNSRQLDLSVVTTNAGDGAAWWDVAPQVIANDDTSIVVDFDVMIAARTGGAVVKVGFGHFSGTAFGDYDAAGGNGAWLSFSGAHADWRYNVKRFSGVPAAVTDQATLIGPAVGTNLWLPVRIEFHGANTPIGVAAGSAVTRFFINQGLVGVAVAQVPDRALGLSLAVVQSGGAAGTGDVRVGPVRSCWNRVLSPSLL